MHTLTFNARHSGYSSLRNMQASLLWRFRRTKPHPIEARDCLCPSRAYRTDTGVLIRKWSIAQQCWLDETVINWSE